MKRLLSRGDSFVRLAYPAKHQLAFGHIDLFAFEASFDPDLGQHAVEVIVAPPRPISRRRRQLGAGDLFDFGECHWHGLAPLMFEVLSEGVVFRHCMLHMYCIIYSTYTDACANASVKTRTNTTEC